MSLMAFGADKAKPLAIPNEVQDSFYSKSKNTNPFEDYEAQNTRGDTVLKFMSTQPVMTKRSQI